VALPIRAMGTLCTATVRAEEIKPTPAPGISGRGDDPGEAVFEGHHQQ
jgi:hypothetical protein